MDDSLNLLCGYFNSAPISKLLKLFLNTKVNICDDIVVSDSSLYACR